MIFQVFLVYYSLSPFGFLIQFYYVCICWEVLFDYFLLCLMNFIVCFSYASYFIPTYTFNGSSTRVSVQSVQSLSCPTLCDPMNLRMPGLSIHHHLLEFTQTHIHLFGDAIQPSHPRSSPSPPAPNPSQHQSFPISQLLAWGGQSTGVSALASVLPMNTQDWFPLEWTGWISLQSKGLSRVFSNPTVQKHRFFGTQLSSQSNFHIHAWPLKNHSLD